MYVCVGVGAGVCVWDVSSRRTGGCMPVWLLRPWSQSCIMSLVDWSDTMPAMFFFWVWCRHLTQRGLPVTSRPVREATVASLN